MNNFWQTAFMLILIFFTFKKVLKLKYGTCVGWYDERVAKIEERNSKILFWFVLLLFEIGFAAYIIQMEFHNNALPTM